MHFAAYHSELQGGEGGRAISLCTCRVGRHIAAITVMCAFGPLQLVGTYIYLRNTTPIVVVVSCSTYWT